MKHILNLVSYYYSWSKYIGEVEAAKDKVNISKHCLVVHSYKGPTFCDYCDEFLWGLVKQGLKCTACGKNFHKVSQIQIPRGISVHDGRRPSSLKSERLATVRLTKI